MVKKTADTSGPTPKAELFEELQRLDLWRETSARAADTLPTPGPAPTPPSVPVPCPITSVNKERQEEAAKVHKVWKYYFCKHQKLYSLSIVVISRKWRRLGDLPQRVEGVQGEQQERRLVPGAVPHLQTSPVRGGGQEAAGGAVSQLRCQVRVMSQQDPMINKYLNLVFPSDINCL